MVASFRICGIGVFCSKGSLTLEVIRIEDIVVGETLFVVVQSPYI
jgi:hypothetical protein